MSERKEVKPFKKQMLETYPDLFHYDYPDTGRAASKKKPPDYYVSYQGDNFLIEWKVPGGVVMSHQWESLFKAERNGVFCYIGTVYPTKTIVFQEIVSMKSFALEYVRGIGYVNIGNIFHNLIKIQRY